MDYKSIIANLIEIEGISSAEIAALITPPKDSKMGDFCLPCFRFSKALRKSPIAIAEELAASITLPDCFEKAEAVAGYLNFTLDKKAYNKRIIEKAVAEGKAYGDQNVGEGKNVCIDYSSVNVAKPLHIGHLSSTAIGAALYRIYKNWATTPSVSITSATGARSSASLSWPTSFGATTKTSKNAA